jgi:hypothetical protein
VGWAQDTSAVAELGKLSLKLLDWVVNTALPTVVSELGKWGKAFIDWVGPKIPPLLQELGKLSGKLLDWIVNTALPDVIKKLGEWAGAFIGWIVPMIPPFLLELAKILVAIGGWIITEALPAIIKKLAEWGGAFLGWVAKDVLPTIASKVGEIAPKIWDKITEIAGDIVAKAADIGAGLINGIINGLAGLGKQMYDSITGMIGGAVQDVKNFFGIKSPSTYTSEHLGNPLGSGIAKGILMAEGEITRAFQDTVGNSVLAVKKAIASDNTIDDVLQHTTSSLKDAQAAWDAFIKAVGAGLGVGGGEGTDSTAASDGEVMNGMLDALNENFNSTARDMQGKAIPAFDELAKSAKALADGLGAAAKSMGDKTNPDGLVYNWNKGLDDMFAHSNNAWIPQTKAIFKVFFNDMTGYFRDYTKDWVQYWQDAMGAMTAPPLPAGAGGGGQQGVGHIGGGSGGGTTNVHVYLDGEEISHALRTVSAIRNDL